MGTFLRDRARELRRNATRPERILWSALRGRNTGFKFRRQHVLGCDIVDFACARLRLAIEVDGIHHAQRVDADAARDARLRRVGWVVLRLSDREVIDEFGPSVARLQRAIAHRAVRLGVAPR